MDNGILLSLCIPTTGISEWVFPVLDSIYNQNMDENIFEVIVTDNGNNEVFYKEMLEYSLVHKNIIYKKTNAYMFDNQLEALRYAHGEYLKFVNHRSILIDGALNKMLTFVQDNIQEKPVFYLSNGVLRAKEKILFYSNFDEYVNGLRRYASWTTGVGIWRVDYEKIPKDKKFDKISPHSGILFSERKRDKYIINDEVFFREIDTDASKKGKYDLFKAFAVEEIAITLNLYIDGSITSKTFKSVRDDYKKFVMELYFDYCIVKKPCSYDISKFDEAMDVFLNKHTIVIGAWLIACKRLLRKIGMSILKR